MSGCWSFSAKNSALRACGCVRTRHREELGTEFAVKNIHVEVWTTTTKKGRREKRDNIAAVHLRGAEREVRERFLMN